MHGARSTSYRQRRFAGSRLDRHDGEHDDHAHHRDRRRSASGPTGRLHALVDTHRGRLDAGLADAQQLRRPPRHDPAPWRRRPACCPAPPPAARVRWRSSSGEQAGISLTPVRLPRLDDLRGRRPTARRLLLGLAEQSSEWPVWRRRCSSQAGVSAGPGGDACFLSRSDTLAAEPEGAPFVASSRPRSS